MYSVHKGIRVGAFPPGWEFGLLPLPSPHLTALGQALPLPEPQVSITNQPALPPRWRGREKHQVEVRVPSKHQRIINAVPPAPST